MRLSIGSIAILLAGLSPTPTTAANLIGDVIFATYDFPCDTCEASDASYTINPFTVDAGLETSLVVGVDSATEVDFGSSSLAFTVLSDITYNPAAFNGPEFTVLTGHPFGSVIDVTSPAGEPVAAHVSGGVLFVNWQGDSFSANDTITITFGVPEAPAWTMMLLGFAFLGAAAFMGNRRSKPRLTDPLA